MAKYIIEIENEPFGRNDDPFFPHGMDELYRAKGFKSLVFDHNGLDKLTPYTEPDRKAIEDEVWEFASMLMNMHPDVAEDIYWSMNGGKGIGVAAEMTYQEAKAKYEAWKREKDKICVGDEVEYECDGIVRFVVFGIVGNMAYGFKYPCDYDDVGEYCDIDMLTKTGRHFDYVEKLLEEMRSEPHEHH